MGFFAPGNSRTFTINELGCENVDDNVGNHRDITIIFSAEKNLTRSLCHTKLPHPRGKLFNFEACISKFPSLVADPEVNP